MMDHTCIQFVFLVVACFSQLQFANSCSTEGFEKNAKACVNGFTRKIKENPQQDCSKPYGELKNCINQAFYECRNKTDSTTLARIAYIAQKGIASEEYFCKYGGMNPFKRNSLPDCKRKALKKVRKCTASFHKVFNEDKASSALCRKYAKSKKCVERALTKHCQKTDGVKNLIKIYQDPFNPYCPGSVDAQKKPVRSSSSPFGACTKRDYLTMSRVCIAGFIQTLQKYPKKSCSLVFKKKLHSCAKNLALHCHQNETSYRKQSIERSFKSSRPIQERRYCNGMYVQFPHPPLKPGQCEESYFEERHKCEESFVAVYKKNKGDKSLCRKYAEAKQCAKNITLDQCNVTPQLRDEVNFIYDSFNPFCFNLKDPRLKKKPRRKKPADRMPRRSGLQDVAETSTPSIGSSGTSKRSGAQSVASKALSLVVGLCLLIFKATIS